MIIASPAQPRVKAEPVSFKRNFSLGHVLQWGVDGETLYPGLGTLDPGLCCQIGHGFKRRDKFWAAIRIAGIIERIDPDEQVMRAARFCKAKAQRKEDGIARRHIGDGNAAFVDELCAFPETEHDDQVDAASGLLAGLGAFISPLDMLGIF